MRVNFENIESRFVSDLNGGEGKIGVRMHLGNGVKVMKSVIPAGASIGIHRHTTSSDFNYVVSGICKAVCDGAEENLTEGSLHYCPIGSAHSIENTGNGDLVLITVVPELKQCTQLPKKTV